MSGRTALLLGATGLVGEHCLDLLLDHPGYGRVIAPVRRPLARRDARLSAPVVPDFAPLAAGTLPFQAVVPEVCEDVFVCLGTTRAKAGSRAAFEHVDRILPAALATRARQAGARRLMLVSALGAHPEAPSFYLRVKGALERAVMELDYEALHLFRPGLLLGTRDEARPAEALAQRMLPRLGLLLAGPLAVLRPVPARTLAAAMVAAARRPVPGIHIYTQPAILALARVAGARAGAAD